MNNIIPFERTYWIIPGKLLAGEYPASADLEESCQKLDGLYRIGIKAVINLTEENENNQHGIPLFNYEDYLTQLGIKVFRKPIKDVSIPTKDEMDDIIGLIDKCLIENQPVYFHCWGGVGRTGTVLGCYLLHNNMANRDNVFDFIDYLKRTTSISSRSSPETKEQKDFVVNYRRTGEKLPLENYIGCLVGGAIGDALGAPIEFNSIASIRSAYGIGGVQDYIEFPDGIGEFTDDTQMTLFTAEGLLRTIHREVIKGIGGALIPITHHSYLRWLYTQGIQVHRENIPSGVYDIEKGWLLKQKILYKQRAPGNTIVSALRSGNCGKVDNPINDSKGCGTVMKIVPVGLILHGKNKDAFKAGCDISAITHGHPSGYLSAGFLASVIADIANGLSLLQSIRNALAILKEWNDYEETNRAVEKAINLFQQTKDRRMDVSAEEVEQLGSGWVAEEALSISLYTSLIHENDFKRGVILAINHSGDSDSTGSITGNILGLINGYDRIPLRWKERLRGEEIVRQMAEDLFIQVKGDSFLLDDKWNEKYPGY
jgi:ADP-ribosylglycohydrolase